jgi:succinate dehydrogenase (ubiquinone) membrane anchor subunit
MLAGAFTRINTHTARPVVPSRPSRPGGETRAREISRILKSRPSKATDTSSPTPQIHHPADRGALMMRTYHASGIALAGLVPTAMVLPLSVLPIDLALGVALPLHSHIALNFVVSDYVPTKIAPVARAGLLGVTALTLFGLFTLNTKGEGITKTVKRLWKAPSSSSKV